MTNNKPETQNAPILLTKKDVLSCVNCKKDLTDNIKEFENENYCEECFNELFGFCL